jgi:hypothetical protein
MPSLKHFYGRSHLHYLTANSYRKARIFDSDRHKRKSVQTPDQLRAELGFRIIGCALMTGGWRRRAAFWHVCDLPT